MDWGVFRMLSRIYRICVIIVIFLLLLNFLIIIYFIYEIEDESFFRFMPLIEVDELFLYLFSQDEFIV